MAEQSAAERSEKPTPERLRKARQEGQVIQSQEVPSALVMGGLLAALVVLGGSLLTWFRHTLTEAISSGGAGVGGDRFCEFLAQKTGGAMIQMAPFLIAAGAMSLVSGLLVGGFVLSPKALKLDWNRIHPVTGLKNLISLQSLVRLLMSLGKMTIIGVICYLYLRTRREEILLLRWASPGEAMSNIASMVFGLLARVVVAMAVIASLDYAFQRWNYMKKLKMTKQEVKEERKQYEASPELKGRMRSMQYDMVRRRMLQEVPNADVVVANPTHVAVALKYDPEEMAAPLVVAKGPDLLCQKIKEIARQHDIPVIEKPELARLLYRTVEVNQPIPSNLFVAVAEILAMVYRIRRKRKRAMQ